MLSTRTRTRFIRYGYCRSIYHFIIIVAVDTTLVILYLILLGNVYIADTDNNLIRKVTVATGIITTIAGGGGGYDGGAATSAGLYAPSGVALDTSGRIITFLFPMILVYTFASNIGNVYIGDFFNHRVRKVTVSTGIISTIAGTGTASYSGDGGAATSATLKYPYGVAVDSSGMSTIVLYTVS